MVADRTKGAVAPISQTDRVVRSSAVVGAMVDGEIVALDATRGACYGLNRVGSRVWELMEAPMSLADICAVLMREYEVDRVTCEGQVRDLIVLLIAQNLALVEGADPPGPR